MVSVKKTNSVRTNENGEEDTDQYQSGPVHGDEHPDMHDDKLHEDKIREKRSNFLNKNIDKLDELAIKARIFLICQSRYRLSCWEIELKPGWKV